jgi:hypothetical protein
MSDEIRSFWYKLLHKWFFPDFSNKITWLVLTLGTSFLLVPAAVKLFIVNWLIDAFNLNSGLPLEFPELEASNNYTVGIILVVLALFHNLGYKYFSFRKEAFEYQVSKELKLSDYKLLESFLDVVPSGCNSMILLKNHDFGNSFYCSHLDQIESFINNWHASEFYFQDEKIDEQRASFLKRSNKFFFKLSSCISPVGTSSLYRVIPQQYVGMPRPAWLSEEIKLLNEMATQLYKAHQDFITLAKSRL